MTEIEKMEKASVDSLKFEGGVYKEDQSGRIIKHQLIFTVGAGQIFLIDC